MPAGLLEHDQMMYAGATPWHKQGVKLDGPATAAEAIAAAGLDWQVIQKEVYTKDMAGRFVAIEDKRAIVRADTGEVFTIMGKGYQPVQNTNSFGLLDEVVAQGGAVYHTAGSLFNGRKIWILAKLPDDITINEADVIQPYILLSNSHDGTNALRMQLTPVRVVCYNTLRFATGEKGGFYGKHTRNIMAKAGEAREILGLANAYYEMFARKADQMLNTRLTVMEVQDYLQKVYQFRADKVYADQDHRVKAAYETTLDLLNHPTNTLGGMAGTAWAAWNAVTYYVDHERIVRGDQRDDKRLDASWFGIGSQIRQRAYDLLVPV
jgi:phage/plasmid-like protein (TIGR03299 family)